MTLAAAAIFVPMQVVMKNLFSYAVIDICKEQTDLQLRELKCEKIGNCMFKTLYFVWATLWGYSVLKDQYYMPKYLGGSGDFGRSMEEFPYAKHTPQLKEYLLITMGYHVGSFVTHFLGTRRNDFIEMGLHHIVSMYLFGGCYMYNQWECGAVIAFLHDIADIFGNSSKALSDTKYQVTTAVYFVGLHMPVWFYTRCLVLPYMISKAFYMRPPQLNPMVIPFFSYLLCCMFVLHVYWFYLFLKIV